MKKAIFLDRDGIINEEIFNKKLKQWTAPHNLKDIIIKQRTLNSLQKLNKKFFLLFIVSNQPDYAKGYVSLKKLKIIHNKIKAILISKAIYIKEFFYSYRHPNSTKKKYGPPCFDRKPNPFFLKLAKKKYSLDMSKSWIIGDRPSDIECGYKAGVKTIGVISKKYDFNKLKNKPSFLAKNISHAINLIIKDNTG